MSAQQDAKGTAPVTNHIQLETTTIADPQPSKKRNNKRKVNYVQLHKDALPLDVYPLPLCHPTNPISILTLVWSYVRQLMIQPKSHSQRYSGRYVPETRSVHITNPEHIRALWERGFFGKGTLSRSEPSWIERERARLLARSQGGQTAEEATKARREERRLFKLERARLERERIDQQRLLEQKQSSDRDETSISEPASISRSSAELVEDNKDEQLTLNTGTPDKSAVQIDIHQIEEQEHLQLTLEEAFFLKYALGVLDITHEHIVDSNLALLNTFRSAAQFEDLHKPGTDDQFLLNYVVYHHFRSLGWVVRPGVKFSVDYLLYNRGPVFSHAEFAILIMPSYSHPHWSTMDGRYSRKVKDQRDWHWLHCINRVQSQVKKTLVLCYVEIPPPSDENFTVRELLSRFTIREFVVRRWLMNRSRD